MVQTIIDGARVPGTDGLNQLDRDFTTCIYVVFFKGLCKKLGQ